jgi:predicted RNase H-like HicB family nuclease
MTELIFLVEQAAEGGYFARALGPSIFTEGDDLESLERNVRDAVHVHFDEAERPRMVRLHFTREEVIAV